MSHVDSTKNRYDVQMKDLTDIGDMIRETNANRRTNERITAAMEQVAQEIGVPAEAITGTSERQPVIEVSIDFDHINGECHRLAYVPNGTALGIVDCYPNGPIVTYGLPRQQWKPPVHVSDAEIAGTLAAAVVAFRAACKENEV